MKSRMRAVQKSGAKPLKLPCLYAASLKGRVSSNKVGANLSPQHLGIAFPSPEAAASAFSKTAVLGQCGCISGSMQHPNDHELMLIVQVVDGIGAGKTDAQAGRKVVSRRGGKWKMKQRIAILLDPVYEPRRGRLGGFDGDVEPDFGEVGFRRVGQAEGERSANSFLPRSTMRAASKFLTRPAATSARPASISAFSAANSSI
jgi:hypothetical protein